jgi:diguanylate cyclase (GGDEF)-like protein
MFDCNELKEINDEYGHERGNEYLVTACRVICGVFSHSPVFRMGGDEFVVLLTGQDYENRTILMQDFDLATEKHNRRAENPWERISVSKGIAAFIPGSDRTVQQVLDRADKRMYEEKRRIKGEEV